MLPYCSTVMVMNLSHLTCFSVFSTQVYICKVCQNAFCVECDVFVHDSLHCCPGCIHEHPAPVSVWWHLFLEIAMSMSLLHTSIFFFYSAIAFTEAPQIKDWDEYRRMNTGLEQTFIFTLCINDFVTVNIFLNYLYLIYFLCPCLKNSGFFWATCIFVNVKVIKLVCIIMWWFIFFHYLFRKEAPKIYFIY